MRRFLILAGICLVMTLCGCTEGKQVDYSLEDTQEDEAADAEEENANILSQFAEAGKWSEELDGTWEDGSSVTLHISADITVPETDSMSVIEVREMEINSAWREQVVKAVFGDETVYYNDDIHLPKAELEEKIAEYETQLDNNQEVMEEYEDNNTNTVAARELQEEKDTLEEKLAACTEALKTASNDYTPVVDYDSDSYCGYRNGVLYTLDITEVNSSSSGRGLEIFLYQKTFDEAVESQSLTEENSDSELTEQEAKNLADSMLEKAGIPGMIMVKSEKITGGYEIYYELGMDTLSLTAFGTENEYGYYFTWAWVNAALGYSLNSKALLHVTEDGVTYLMISNPVEIINVTKEVDLLPLENIQSIIQSKLTEPLEQFHFEKEAGKVQYLDSLELIYFRVKDTEREGYYSYVPAWRLSDTQQNTDAYITYNNTLLVNAIDGSVIDLYNELSEGAQTEKEE